MREFLKQYEESHWVINVIVFTRHWIHYGGLLFVSVLILAAAAEGMLRP